MRTCRTCGESKPATKEHFNLQKAGKGGLEAWCRVCRNAWMREVYRRDPEHRAELSLRWRTRNPERFRAALKKWPAAHPEFIRLAARAQQAVLRAERKGLIVRPAQCSQCGSTQRIEAAHRDYSKPLDVRWLCRTCHVRWDRAEPKHLISQP